MTKKKNSPNRSNGNPKSLIISIIAVAAFIIFMQGNNVGQFRYDGRYYWIVCGVICLLSLIVLVLMFKKRVSWILKEGTWKDWVRILFLLGSGVFFSTAILNGVINYVDYFAGTKKWQHTTAVVVNISSRYRSKTGTTYTYEMATNKENIMLKSSLRYYPGDTLQLKIATTPLENMVAEIR